MKKYVWCVAILFGFLCLVSNAAISQDNILGKWKAKKVNGKINLHMRIIQKRDLVTLFSHSFPIKLLKTDSKERCRLVKVSDAPTFYKICPRKKLYCNSASLF